MKIKVKMVIMSHLSDVQEMLGDAANSTIKEQNERLNFAKYLLLKYPNTDIEIDADIVALEFDRQDRDIG
jgi:hypothetical protein